MGTNKNIHTSDVHICVFTIKVINYYTHCNSHHTTLCIQLMIFQWKVMHKVDRKQCTLIFKKKTWYIINGYSLILRKKPNKMIKVTEIIKPIAFDYFYTVRRHCILSGAFIFVVEVYSVRISCMTATFICLFFAF